MHSPWFWGVDPPLFLFQRGHLWQLPWQPVCHVWWRSSVLGCLGCNGLPSADKVSLIMADSVYRCTYSSVCMTPNSRNNPIGSRCWRCSTLPTWRPPMGSEVSLALPSGSVTRAQSHRRSSWTPCVPTSSSAQRCPIPLMTPAVIERIPYPKISHVSISGEVGGVSQVPQGWIPSASSQPQCYLWDPVWPPAETHTQEHVMGLGQVWGKTRGSSQFRQ